MEEFKSLFPEFTLLTISVIVFLGVILYNKLYRKSMCIFYLLILTELFTPAVYYVVLSSQNYVKFGVDSLRTYILLSAVAFICYSLILAFLQKINFEPTQITVTRWNLSSTGKRTLLALLSIGLISVLLLYLFIYREGLPLYQALFEKNFIERPDTTGGIPHWFTVSALLCVAVPCLYLYYHQKQRFHWIINLGWIGFTALLMVLGGNKGFVVYWFLFLWVYLWGMKLDARIMIAGIASVIVLLIIMTGGTSISFRGFLSGLDYGLGRFFLTQGAMLVNRFELIAQGFEFDMSIITAQVFTFVYGREGGSSPTYFMGDLLVQFGLAWGFLLHLLVFFLLALFGRWLDCHPFSEYRTWLFFCVQYFLGMSSISPSFLLRFALLIALWILFSVLDSPALNAQKVRHGIPLHRHGLSRNR